MKTKLFNIKGQAKSDFTFSKEFDVKSNKSILDQAVRVFEDSTHFGLNKVKTRSQVNISKRKIYRQKGTGGARHGAKSAHIFVGGGVVHGPTGLKRTLSLSTKMKQLAKSVSITKAIKDNKLVVVEDLVKISKTKEVNSLLNAIRQDLKVNGKLTLVLSDENKSVRRYARNISDLNVVDYNTLNAFNVVSASLLVVDEKIFEGKKETKVKEKVERKKVVKK